MITSNYTRAKKTKSFPLLFMSACFAIPGRLTDAKQFDLWHQANKRCPIDYQNLRMTSFLKHVNTTSKSLSQQLYINFKIWFNPNISFSKITSLLVYHVQYSQCSSIAMI